jgi:hypothetical protein
VIIDEARAWSRFNIKARKFIKSIPGRDRLKIILFFSAADPSWPLSLNGIDGITSASTADRVMPASADIIKRIMEIESAGTDKRSQVK